MELAIMAELGIIILASVIAGYKMGKGEPIQLPKIRLKKAVRSEAQEADLIDKLNKGR